MSYFPPFIGIVSSGVLIRNHRTGGTPTDWEDSTDDGVDNADARPTLKEITPEGSDDIERYVYTSHLEHLCLNFCLVGNLLLFARS